MSKYQLWRQYSENIFRYVEKLSSVAVDLLDRQGNILHCNHAFLALLHLSAAPLNQSMAEYLSPETCAGLSWEHRITYVQENWHLKTQTGYYRVQCHIFAENSGFLIFFDKPLLTDSFFAKEFDAINRDLSAMSRELSKKNAVIETANRNLKEKEAILKQAAEMANIGHWQWSFPNDVIVVSGTLCRLWDAGLQDRAMSKAEFLSRFIAEDVPKFMNWLNELKETCRPGELEFRYFGIGGIERYGYCRADVRCDISSRRISLNGVIQDISERKLYEQKIERIAYSDSLTGLPNRKMFEDFFIK